MIDSTLWQVAKPLGAIALMGGAVWGFTRLLDATGDAMDRSNDARDLAKRNVTGGSIQERIERTERATMDDHVTHATVLVRAFDQNGDDRLARDEWKLQAGSDSLDGTRLFSAAQYAGTTGHVPTEAVTIDQVVATLDQFAEQDFVGRLNDGKHYHALRHFERSLQPTEADDARDATQRGLFDRNGDGAKASRPVGIAAAEVLARYDADGDGTISIDGESTYVGGDFTGDATRLLDQADNDGSGDVGYRELRAHLATLDAWSAQDWEPEPVPNGLLDGDDFRGVGLDTL